MRLETEKRGGTVILRVAEPRLDAQQAIEFRDRFRAALPPGARRVVLDLAEVEFIDSSGLGAVVAVMKAAGPEVSFELAGLTPLVAKVFRLTRMDTVFRIHGSVAQALLPGGNGAGDDAP